MVIRVNPTECPYCGGILVKNGKRYNIYFYVQRFRCKNCIRTCMDRTDEFKGFVFEDEIIQEVVRLARTGNSSRQIQRILKLGISHKTLVDWMNRFIINPNFQVNGSHRPEIREKISITLKSKPPKGDKVTKC